MRQIQQQADEFNRGRARRLILGQLRVAFTSAYMHTGEEVPGQKSRLHRVEIRPFLGGLLPASERTLCGGDNARNGQLSAISSGRPRELGAVLTWALRHLTLAYYPTIVNLGGARLALAGMAPN
jgi:hypothetical protein